MQVLELALRISFVAVVLAGGMWALRRWGRANASPDSGDTTLKVLGRLTVGRHAHVLLVQAGNRRVVVGVGQHVHVAELGHYGDVLNSTQASAQPVPTSPDEEPLDQQESIALAQVVSAGHDPSPVSPSVVAANQTLRRLGEWLGFVAPAPQPSVDLFAQQLVLADAAYEETQEAKAGESLQSGTAEQLASTARRRRAAFLVDDELLEVPAPASAAPEVLATPAEAHTDATPAVNDTQEYVQPPVVPRPRPSAPGAFVPRPVPVVSSTAAFNAGVRVPASQRRDPGAGA